MTMSRRSDLFWGMLRGSLDVFQHFESGQSAGRAHDAAAGVRCPSAHAEILDGCAKARIAWRRAQKEKLLERKFSLKDVAFAQTPFAFEIERGNNLPVQDDVF